MRVQNSTRQRLALVEFMSWPLDKRQQFIAQEMPDTPDFIKIPLLRPTVH